MRIISDLHLGHTASRLKSAAMLDPILDGVDRNEIHGTLKIQGSVDSPKTVTHRARDSIALNYF